MARETHSDSVKIEQPGSLEDILDRTPEIVLVDAALINKEYKAELAFMADWITIRLEPSGAENAPDTFPVSVNGVDAEVLINDRPVKIKHLPVGPEITVRRSVVEIIARSKTMRVATPQDPNIYMQLQNKLNRTTSQAQPFTIIHDPSPRGRAWAQEMIRRPY